MRTLPGIRTQTTRGLNALALPIGLEGLGATDQIRTGVPDLASLDVNRYTTVTRSLLAGSNRRLVLTKDAL
jgi:hypothetical protein